MTTKGKLWQKSTFLDDNKLINVVTCTTDRILNATFLVVFFILFPMQFISESLFSCFMNLFLSCLMFLFFIYFLYFLFLHKNSYHTWLINLNVLHIRALFIRYIYIIWAGKVFRIVSTTQDGITKNPKILEIYCQCIINLYVYVNVNVYVHEYMSACAWVHVHGCMCMGACA